jgi:hypothetical protein
MDRRDALKSLAGLGLTITPLTTHDADRAEVLVVKSPGPMSLEMAERLRNLLPEALKGTAFENIRILVLADGCSLEVLRQDRE